MDGKPWYLSKTLWGLIVTVLGIVFPKLPIKDNSGFLTDQLVQVAGNVAATIGIALAAYGRIKSTGPLTLTDQRP